eukprot:gene29579-5934_t
MEDRVIAHDLSGDKHFNGCCSRAVLLGVFDGHNGMEAAEYLRTSFLGHFLTRENLGTQQWGAALHRTLLACEKHLLGHDFLSGTTALVALLVDNKLHLANVGDCRAVVSDDGEGRALTRDHKPPCNPMEKERIELAGAKVNSEGYVTWNGSSNDQKLELMVSLASSVPPGGPVRAGDPLGGPVRAGGPLGGLVRAGGDGGVEDSAAVIIAEPDLFVYSVHQDSEFLILASDGVWDTVSNTEAVRQIRRRLVDGASPELAAAELVKYALTMGSGDNVAAVVLRFSSRTLSQSSSTKNSVLGRCVVVVLGVYYG